MSASLHLVDESDAKRFGDVEPHRVKGLVMQPQQDGSKARQEEERIKRVRQMRRSAVRRRQILALSLLLITLVVGVLAVTVTFSLLYCLIPLALLGVVLVSGAHASAQARQWEERLAARQNRQLLRSRAAAPVAARPVQAKESDQTTAALSQEDIRAAIILARKMQEKALAVRSAQQMSAAQEDRIAEHAVREAIQHVSSQASAAASQPESQVDQPAHKVDAAKQVKAAASSESNREPVLTAAQAHTLLSFSMGQSRDGQVLRQNEPLSLEIKSTKQVAQAVPKLQAQPKRETQAQESDSSVRSSRKNNPNSKPEDFHRREVQADVDAPEVSDDSLGKVGVEAILARRSNS
ncbi:hypothetical protein KIMH_12930 [Bombiscardovia apis]|uniref:Membrane associated protein n=2 Tax=Bombiscardovia apis TaxID=2932182 RepID=A0ABN6SGP8_9BIFI|nr:hypothetical protein KIMH_12930 [Bombiscardovia apis]